MEYAVTKECYKFAQYMHRGGSFKKHLLLWCETHRFISLFIVHSFRTDRNSLNLTRERFSSEICYFIVNGRSCSVRPVIDRFCFGIGISFKNVTLKVKIVSMDSGNFWDFGIFGSCWTLERKPVFNRSNTEQSAVH